jgi:hypothetical protein
MNHGTRRSALSLLPVLALLASPEPARAQVGLRPLPSFEARSVEFAREGAIRRLREPGCQLLLEELADAEGHPLTAKLASFGVSADQYLAMIPFLDGTGRPLCKGGQSQLLTARGVARVLVCPPFLQTVERERVTAEVYVIHEMLHTLGLGENPPTSQEITQRVKRQCAP